MKKPKPAKGSNTNVRTTSSVGKNAARSALALEKANKNKPSKPNATKGKDEIEEEIPPHPGSKKYKSITVFTKDADTFKGIIDAAGEGSGSAIEFEKLMANYDKDTVLMALKEPDTIERVKDVVSLIEKNEGKVFDAEHGGEDAFVKFICEKLIKYYKDGDIEE